MVPKGAMIFQPSEERRRSGSHYTPRSLTEPIVRNTLEPILARLRGRDEEEGSRPPRPEQILDLKVCDPAMGSGAFLVEACRRLGDELVESWRAHDAVPEIPPDEDEVVFARRLIAQRCLYGVDRNPVAVDLSKVSLWLVTLAKGHALTFVDHALRHGDSLVGLSRKQVEAFHWDQVAQSFSSRLSARIASQLKRVDELRRYIRNADESVSDWEKRDSWDEARAELSHVRALGDLVVSAFFEGRDRASQEQKRSEFVKAVVNDQTERYLSLLEEQRHGPRPLAPFHWEIEFPEVFDRENGGLDAVVGNPPFGGKNTILNANAAGYPDWLKHIHQESHGNADLVAHFFRRAFDLLRDGGAFGLIATNTIAQGDTRTSGLRWICQHGGEIFLVRKRVLWPGLAAVIVSVIHVSRGALVKPKRLGSKVVDKITAFLSHRGDHNDPVRLSRNDGKSFLGSCVLGMGFTFDDSDKKGIATPLAEMRRLIEKDPRNAERIFPYVGGEEVNDSPAHEHHRFVIDFFDRDLREAEKWPDLIGIVRDRVKPDRDRQKRKALRERWWQFAEKRPGMVAAIAGLHRVLVVCRHQPQWAATFMGASSVFAESLIVFPLTTFAAFSAIQSRVHEIWARFFGSTMKDDLRYTPSDCFQTFPFPEKWETHPALEAAGKAYYQFRAALMVERDEGLTKTYNLFHDPDERRPEIVQLRELHAAMDRAVLDAYGWSGIPTECEFLLDYEIDEEEWGSKKRPWRYRWPDEIHDEVLARLLQLNAEQAKEEAASGAMAKRSSKKKGKHKSKDSLTGDLFS